MNDNKNVVTAGLFFNDFTKSIVLRVQLSSVLNIRKSVCLKIILFA